MCVEDDDYPADNTERKRDQSGLKIPALFLVSRKSRKSNRIERGMRNDKDLTRFGLSRFDRCANHLSSAVSRYVKNDCENGEERIESGFVPMKPEREKRPCCGTSDWFHATGAEALKIECTRYKSESANRRNSNAWTMTPLVPINTAAILRIPRIVHLTTTLVCATIVFASTLYSTTAPCRYEGCSMGILLYIPVLCCASLSIVVTLARIVRLIRASSHRTPGAAIRGFVWWTGLGFLVWLGLTIWSGILTWSWDEREGREVGKTCTRHLPEHDDPSGREGNWFAVCIFPDLLWAACLCGLLNYAYGAVLCFLWKRGN